jgi:hypothetical protein
LFRMRRVCSIVVFTTIFNARAFCGSFLPQFPPLTRRALGPSLHWYQNRSPRSCSSGELPPMAWRASLATSKTSSVSESSCWEGASVDCESVLREFMEREDEPSISRARCCDIFRSVLRFSFLCCCSHSTFTSSASSSSLCVLDSGIFRNGTLSLFRNLPGFLASAQFGQGSLHD